MSNECYKCAGCDEVLYAYDNAHWLRGRHWCDGCYFSIPKCSVCGDAVMPGGPHFCQIIKVDGVDYPRVDN